MVHVVSMLEVIISDGEMTFQSSEVSGAVKSVDFELDRRARGVSFCTGAVYDRLVMELFAVTPGF